MKKLQFLFGLLFILLSQLMHAQPPGSVSGDGSSSPITSSPYYQLNSSTTPVSTWYLRFTDLAQEIQFSRGGTHSALRLRQSSIYADVNLIANQKIGIGNQGSTDH